MKTLPLCAAIFALVACAGEGTNSSQLADDATYDYDFEDAPLFVCEGRGVDAKIFPTYQSSDAEHKLLVEVKMGRSRIEEVVDAKYNFSVRYGGTLNLANNLELAVHAQWDNDTYDVTGFTGELRNDRTSEETDLVCEATKFKPQTYVQDAALNDWLKIAKEASDREVFGNAAIADAYRLQAVPRTERFEQTIKQLMFGDYDDGVTVERQDNSYSTVDDTIDDLTGQETGWGESIDPNELRRDMKRKLKAAIYHRDHMKVFTGNIDSNFCWGLSFIAVIDTRNDQMVVFGEGACE